jgi:hypothetical protein
MKIKSGLFTTLITTSLVIHLSVVNAGEVCYTPLRGGAITKCAPKFDLATGEVLDPCPEMLGQYRLVLKKLSPGPGKFRLKLAGPLHGTVNPDQTLNHILGDEQASGLIYTFGDTLIEQFPDPTNECLLHVKEVLNVTLGTDKYTGAHGNITVVGELNLCTGVNEFDLERNQDVVCFDRIVANQRLQN